ncbi:MAG: ATPase [Thermoplasmata archaeon]|nr:MAG: ATPase [Thermoplasmata archaeon]
MSENYFAGVDVGASATKAVVIDSEARILGSSIKRTTTNLGKLAEDALQEALNSAKISRDSIKYIVATGYGRENVEFANEMRTEISCHSKGGRYAFKDKNEPMVVIDIGGQDNKVIKLDKDGKIINFKMNRKCAAGTGAFLEEIALKLDTASDCLDELERGATEDIMLGSFCTVFTSTEILEKIKEGESKENMVKGAFISVVKRIAEMETLEGTVILTGGVIAHNPLIGEILEKQLNVKVHIPENAQLAGAFGAALYARERFVEHIGE